jgi:hypothetical protein
MGKPDKPDKVVIKANSDWASHDGTKEEHYENGRQTREIHHTPDGKSHEHEVYRTPTGVPYAGETKKP